MPNLASKSVSPESDFVAKLPLNLGSDAFVNNKYEHYAWLREEAPVCPGKISLFRLKLLSRYEDCDRLAKDERFLRNRTRAVGGSRFPIPLPKSVQAVAYSMIVEDDPEHRRLRGLVNQAFKPASVNRLGDQIEELTEQLLDKIKGQQTIDLLRDFALPIPVTMIQRLMGVPEREMPQFREVLRHLSDGLSGFQVIRTIFWDLPRSLRFMRAMVEKKRHHPEDDILTLLQHPDQLERLRADPGLIGSAVEEVQRFNGPVHGAKLSYATEDIDWNRELIRRGEPVMPLYGAANHDPTAFDDPETFDIARESNHHFGFGHGVHFCLGGQLARMETKVALMHLFERYPDLRLAVSPDTLKLENLPGWHRYKALPVRLS